MPAFNGWYHCMSSTYGAWLPGDPRGFRTRSHREHVEGDYKNPPPAGVYEQRHETAKGRMKRPAVVLSAEARRVVVKEIQDSLTRHGVEVIALSVSATHMHVLARFPLSFIVNYIYPPLTPPPPSSPPSRGHHQACPHT